MNSRYSYENFLKIYPESKYSIQCQEKLNKANEKILRDNIKRDEVNWDESKKEDKTSGYIKYIKNAKEYSRHIKEAKNRIETILWNKASKQGSPAQDKELVKFWQPHAINNLVRYCHEGKYVNKKSEYCLQADELLEDYYWKNTYTRALLLEYKNKYPNGRYLKQADKKLKKMADVSVTLPAEIQSRNSFYNISGPVWVFEPTFKEKNNVKATILSSKITLKDGQKKYGDLQFTDIVDAARRAGSRVVEIAVPAGGTAHYQSFIRSDKETTKELHIEYFGVDENDYRFLIKVDTLLVL